MKQIFFAAIISVSLFVIPAIIFADTPVPVTTAPTPVSTQSFYKVPNPLGSGNNSFCGLVQNLLKAALAIGIPIAVLFIVYAGFKFVMAQGNSTKLQEARNNFMWTLVGIGIFLGAWLLASVVANTINALGAGSGTSSIISCN